MSQLAIFVDKSRLELLKTHNVNEFIVTIPLTLTTENLSNLPKTSIYPGTKKIDIESKMEVEDDVTSNIMDVDEELYDLKTEIRVLKEKQIRLDNRIIELIVDVAESRKLLLESEKMNNTHYKHILEALQKSVKEQEQL